VTLHEILELVGDNFGWIVILVLSFVEVSKIKINPWTKLFNWLGNLFFSGIRTEISSMKEDVTKEITDVKADVTKEITAVKTEVTDVKTDLGTVKSDIGEMKDDQQEDKAKAARKRILRCSDEVYNGIRHSKEFFDDVLSDITFYKAYCKAHPDFQNDMTVMAVERIEEVYCHCLKDHDFL